MSEENQTTSKDHRKNLIREYKKTPKEMGVYGIRNLSNGKLYVAISRDIRARFNRHLMELKTNAARPPVQLQEDWNRLGPDSFEFITLELLEGLDDPAYDPAEDLEFLQAHWLEKLSPYDDAGYNQRPTTS